MNRDNKICLFFEIDSETGTCRLLLEEKSQTYVELTPVIGAQPNIAILKDGMEWIWPSDRSGWLNLYRYDAETGRMMNPVASGPFVVWEIKYIDEEAGWIYFLASGKEQGRNPYYRHLYWALLDGNDLQLLTPEDAEHEITVSPGGRYFVDTFSRIDQLPVTILRSSNGEQSRVLQTADVTLLEQMGWQAPVPFTVKARDGVTDLYGAIYRPSHFDPNRTYPVLDSIYPGPQMIRTHRSFQPDRGCAESVAELGFIVIALDGLGNMGRSKAHHNLSHGKLCEAGGLEDHIHGLRQLADCHPYLDLSRVGIWGHSGGGYASARAILQYPDFYKVAVSSVGNHDQRGYLAGWFEMYNGPAAEEYLHAQSNASLAFNLKGKLMLATGDMDDNVHMALTMQLVNALIQAGKDFDLLVMPNRNHGFYGEKYFIRKLWDYFVTHLMGCQPPQGFIFAD